jgi:hypothetical protein
MRFHTGNNEIERKDGTDNKKREKRKLTGEPRRQRTT